MNIDLLQYIPALTGGIGLTMVGLANLSSSLSNRYGLIAKISFLATLIVILINISGISFIVYTYIPLWALLSLVLTVLGLGIITNIIAFGSRLR